MGMHILLIFAGILLVIIPHPNLVSRESTAHQMTIDIMSVTVRLIGLKRATPNPIKRVARSTIL
jgi:hypothetical protein